MIRSIVATNYLGQSIELELAAPEKSGFAVLAVDGLGPGRASINVSEISTTDGALYNSARLSSRNILLYLRFLHNPTIEHTRQLSYRYFPIKKPITLVIQTDNRLLEIQGYVESNEPNIFSRDQGCSISIICPNPYFYSSGQSGLVTTIFSSIEPLLEFPFSNESTSEPLINLGSLINVSQRLIIYDGDSEVGVTIVIHAVGEATNLTIYNTTTLEQMSIDTDKLEAYTGDPIIAGDKIVISTVKGQKFVYLERNGVITNILNCLVPGADWLKLVKGDNVFAYTADTGATNLLFRIENRIIYEGV